MTKSPGLTYLKRLAALMNSPMSAGREGAIQAAFLSLKRYIERLESKPKDAKAEDLVALRQQVTSLQTTNSNLEERILDLEEVKDTLGQTLKETKQELANERRRTTRLTKRLENGTATKSD